MSALLFHVPVSRSVNCATKLFAAVRSVLLSSVTSFERTRIFSPCHCVSVAAAVHVFLVHYSQLVRNQVPFCGTM